MKKLLLAFQFLTIFPVPILNSKKIDERDIGGSSTFFPLVGLFQGLIIITVYLLSIKIFTMDITAVLIIITLLLTNGGLHIDGLSDTFDALTPKKTQRDRLEIMRESAAGPMGVTAIVLTLLLKYSALRHILGSSQIPDLPLLIIMPVIGRWSMAPAIFHGKSARKNGLGKTFIENKGITSLLFSTIFVTAIVAASFIIYNLYSYNSNDILYGLKIFFSVPVIYLFSLFTVKFFSNHFGGITGDNLGAISEMSEALLLLIFLILF